MLVFGQQAKGLPIKLEQLLKKKDGFLTLKY